MFFTLIFYRATLYAGAVYAVVVCPSSVRLSVRLSQAGIVSKPLNTESLR